MKLDFYHNRIVADTITAEFEHSFKSRLLPLLEEKYGVIPEIQMYEDYIADDFNLDGYWYYPLTIVTAVGETTQWIRWSVNKVDFEDGIPYAYVGSGDVSFELVGIPVQFEAKLQGRSRYCSDGSVKIRIETLGGDPTKLSGKYSQTFIDEMARQLTVAIELAAGVQGIADSSVELVMVFAPGTYMEHTSENRTYRRLMLIDKVSAPRDFWIQWTRLDGAVAHSVSSHVSAENILFELGEDVEQKIREREYRYLLTSGKEKYHNAMGRRKVTEWREVIKRAAKRGELTRIEADFELAPETLELEERIADLLGKRIAEKQEPVKEEIPYIKEDDEFAKAMEKARMVVAQMAEQREEEFEDLAEISEEIELAEETEAQDDDTIEFEPQTEEEDLVFEDPEFSEDELEELQKLDEECDEFEELEDESEELDDEEIEELDEFEESEEPEEIDELDDIEDWLTSSNHEDKVPAEEPTPVAPESVYPEDFEIAEPVAEEPVEEEPAAEIDEPVIKPVFEVTEPVIEPIIEIEEPVATSAADQISFSDEFTPLADRAANIRAEIEAKIRLEYETRARIKAEQELIALRREQEKLKMEKEAFEAEAEKEIERLAREYEMLRLATKRAEQERAAREAQRRAEEAKLREQIEVQLRHEAQERERLVEAARLAIEEQHRLEAENARIARLREEEIRREEEQRKREREEREFEALRQAELERIRLEEEAEARERGKAAMPDMGDGRYSYTSKSVKFIFRKSVDPNITNRIYEIMKATVEYYGKDKVYLKIKATVADSQTVIIDFEQIPIEEMELLGNIIKILGNSGLGIAKAIIE